MFTVLPKIFALAPTYRRFAEKNRLGGDTGACTQMANLLFMAVVQCLNVSNSQ